MSRYKGIIGSKLRSRDFESQQNEIKIGCKILNTMLKLGTPLHRAMTAKYRKENVREDYFFIHATTQLSNTNSRGN